MESMSGYECASTFFPTKSETFKQRCFKRKTSTENFLFLSFLMTSVKSFIKYVCLSFYSNNEENF